MIRHISLLLCVIMFLTISKVCAQPPESKLLEGKGTDTAVILAHGREGDPDSKVVGPLRKTINTELNFHTLSLQMPVLPGEKFKEYARVFPDAYKTISDAINFLTKEKGVKRIYLMGYSMGARMTSAFLAKQPHPAIIGYIGIGMLTGGGAPLNANWNIKKVEVPVIDIYATETPLDRKSAKKRQKLVSDTYKQVRIDGAEHSFSGYDSQIAQAVIAWLKQQEKNQ